MALTKAQLREILSKAGVAAESAEDAISSIMDGHLASVNALREERDKFKEDAEKLPAVQKELDEIKGSGDDSYKSKYEKEHAEFEKFKADQTAKETKANKTAAFRKLLKEAGVSEKRLDTVIRASAPDIDGIELDKDGKIKDAEGLTKTVKENWADFITKKESKGANSPNPPANSGGKKSREEIYKKDDKGRYVMDATERQQALAELMASEDNE